MRAGYDRIGRTVSLKQASSQCLGKQRYGSKNEARDEASRKAKRHPEWDRLYPYGCTICQGFHLSRTRPLEYGKRVKPIAVLERQPEPTNNHDATAPRKGVDRPDESEKT